MLFETLATTGHEQVVFCHNQDAGLKAIIALQIWAETGMIGAVLAALSLVALAFHLPRPGDLPREIRLAIAGLAGAATVIFSFAYSLWNEGFWASLALAAAVIILWHRTLREAEA